MFCEALIPSAVALLQDRVPPSSEWSSEVVGRRHSCREHRDVLAGRVWQGWPGPTGTKDSMGDPKPGTARKLGDSKDRACGGSAQSLWGSPTAAPPSIA